MSGILKGKKSKEKFKEMLKAKGKSARALYEIVEDEVELQAVSKVLKSFWKMLGIEL